MGVEGIGASVVRKEDRRFITGKGRYVDDIKVQGMTHAYFIRSPHAHARITGIELDEAKAMPGVVDVLTGQQIVDDKVGNLICGWAIHSKDGSAMKMGAWPAMAPEIVRFVGQAVAVVIAETKNLARDAAEAVVIHYEELQAVPNIATAIAAGAPQLHPEAPGNVVYDWAIGDEAATNDAFGKAANVVKFDLVNNRLVPNAMEPRAALGRIQRSRRALHAAHHLAEPACGAAGAVGVLQHRARAQAARRRARRRRRLRLQDLHLSGRDGGAVGVEEGAPSGEMDRRPLGGLPHRRAWPRPRLARRDGVRRRQQDSGPAGEDPRQFRRLYVAVLVLGADLSLRHAAVGPIQHSGDLCRGDGRLHQHHAGRRLSRRRATGGLLSRWSG